MGGQLCEKALLTQRVAAPVVSAAADETLRFWKCFSDSDAGKAKKLKDGASDSSVLRRFNFR